MDNEQEPTSPRAPFASYPPSPERLKSRAPEFYGFVAWSSTYFLFVIYVLWALLPDSWIKAAGVDWYPNREWAILLPAYSVILILLTYFSYWALTLYNTPGFNHFSTITDVHALVHASEENPIPTASATDADAIPTPYDIPISIVNRTLYCQQSS